MLKWTWKIKTFHELSQDSGPTLRAQSCPTRTGSSASVVFRIVHSLARSLVPNVEASPLKHIPMSDPGPQGLFSLASPFLLSSLTKTSDPLSLSRSRPQVDHFSYSFTSPLSLPLQQGLCSTLEEAVSQAASELPWLPK